MEAVIFDFDGTIVDTEALWIDVYQELIQERYEYEVPLEVFQACIGTQDTSLYDYLTTHVDAHITRDELSPFAEKRVNERLVDLPVKDGITDLLRTLYEHGVRMAIASGSQLKFIAEFINKHSIAHYFEAIRCADDVVHVKPHPEIYEEALFALNLEPEQCIAIEDSENGAKSAVAAKIPCIVVPNDLTSSGHFPEEVTILSTIEEAKEQILAIHTK